jgi:hypothetical protein
VVFFVVGAVSADDAAIRDFATEDFTMQPETRWRFFTDQVMGGVSTGGVVLAKENGEPYGPVSTANRTGFIQMLMDLAIPPPDGTTGMRLVVRGNRQRYFVYLRTGGTLSPWQYYQAGFDVTENLSEVRLPMDGFTASSALLRDLLRPASLTSVAVVDHGQDRAPRSTCARLGSIAHAMFCAVSQAYGIHSW